MKAKLTAAEIKKIRTKISEHKESNVCKALGNVSRLALLHALADLPVYPGTISLIRAHWAGLEELGK
jgi:hypothetical protein